MDGWLAAVLVFAGVLVGGLINYLIAKRNTSGSISTSDAKSLWDESNKLRKEYRDRAESLEEQLEQVNARLQSVLDELAKLRASSAIQIDKIDELQKIIEGLRSENQRLLELKKETSQ